MRSYRSASGSGCSAVSRLEMARPSALFGPRNAVDVRLERDSTIAGPVDQRVRTDPPASGICPRAVQRDATPGNLGAAAHLGLGMDEAIRSACGKILDGGASREQGFRELHAWGMSAVQAGVNSVLGGDSIEAAQVADDCLDDKLGLVSAGAKCESLETRQACQQKRFDFVTRVSKSDSPSGYLWTVGHHFAVQWLRQRDRDRALGQYAELDLEQLEALLDGSLSLPLPERAERLVEALHVLPRADRILVKLVWAGWVALAEEELAGLEEEWRAHGRDASRLSAVVAERSARERSERLDGVKRLYRCQLALAIAKANLDFIEGLMQNDPSVASDPEPPLHKLRDRSTLERTTPGERAALAEHLGQRISQLARRLGQLRQELGRFPPKPRDWREIAFILGRIDDQVPEEQVSKAVNTLTQRYRRISRGLLKKPEAPR